MAILRPMVGWDETSVRVSVTKDEVDTKSVKPLRDENEKSDRISRGLGRFKKTRGKIGNRACPGGGVPGGDPPCVAVVACPGAPGADGGAAAAVPHDGAGALVPYNGGALKRKRFGHGRAITTTIQHSCVISMCMGICNIAHLREPQRWKGRTMALPPMEVSSTNNVCVGKAVILSLEQRIFNCTLREWFRAHGHKFKLWFWVLLMDFASSNRTFVRKLEPLLRSHLGISTLVCVWVEVCKLHKLGRIMKKVAKRHRVGTALYSVSRILQHKHSFRLFRDGYLSFIEENHCQDDVAGIEDDKYMYGALKRTLKVVWGDPNKDLNTLSAHAFESWWKFYFGDETQELGLLQGNGQVRGHRCMVATCNNTCTGPDSSAKEGGALTHNLFFKAKPPMYNDGRWTKQVPALKYFSRLFVFSRSAVIHGLRNILRGHKKMEQKRKARLTRCLAFFETEGATLTMLTSLFTGCILQDVVHHLFRQHSVDQGSVCKDKDDAHTVM